MLCFNEVIYLKQGTKFLSLLSLLLACVLVCASLFQSFDAALAVNETDADGSEWPVIILDPGHGGEDGGATGTNGALEKELNLSLTQTLAALLRGAGYTVVQTRNDDRLLYDPTEGSKHKKQRDLEGRLAFCEQYPNSIFISIHMNTFPNDSCRGTQVWYSQNHPASQDLANALQSSVKTLLQPQNNRRVKAATSGIYILRHAKNPAVLVECGFLSTPEECALLCDKEYQKSLALCLFAAISEKISAGTCESYG